MARPPINLELDLSVLDNKRRLMASIAPLTGWYEVSIKPRRNTRSQQQNRYYWGVVLKSLVDYMADQGEHYTTDQIHEMYKLKFLRQSVVDHNSGEVVGQTTTSTTKLDVKEFGDYLEKVIAHLAEFFGIVVPEAGSFATQEAQNHE